MKDLKIIGWAALGAAFVFAFVYLVVSGGNADIVFTGLGAVGIKMLTGFLFVRVALKNLDNFLDFDFKEWLSKAPPETVGVYLSSRIIAISILAGLVLS